jgi:ABC-2 type transport system ATP-binding protein
MKGDFMEYVIETGGLTKRYGSKLAVNNVCLHVKAGDIYGLIGRNGAGKTTLMKLLLGITLPTDGDIRLFGDSNPDLNRSKIGSLIETPVLYEKQSAFENMKRFAILSPTSDDDIMRILSIVKLAGVSRKKVCEFSLGMRQRLGIAIALLGKPEILILDEPINGLDPTGIREVRDTILDLNRKGVTFIISSHILDELGKTATNYGIISSGVMVEELSAEELEERCRTAFRFTVNYAQAALEVLQNAHENLQMQASGDSILRILTPVEDASVFIESLVRGGIRVYEASREHRSYEDFFIERMGR